MLDHRMLMQHDFGVLNPLQMEPSFWSDLETLPVVPVDFEAQAHLMPRLVPVRGIPVERCVDLLDRSDDLFKLRRRPLFSALIRTEARADDVRSWLARTLIQKTPDGGRILFRFYDPRVFMHLGRIFGKEGLSRLVSPISCWSYQNPLTSHWDSLHCETSQKPMFSIQTRRQLDSLLRLPHVNRSAGRIDFATESDPEGALARVAGLVDRAIDEEALSDRDDIELFVANCIRYGESIHEADALRTLLKSVRSGASSYVGGCTELGEAWFESLAGRAEKSRSPMSHSLAQ